MRRYSTTGFSSVAASLVRTASLVTLAVASVGGCGTVEQGPTTLIAPGLSTEVLAVGRSLSGNFTNTTQHQRDSEYGPFSLHLRRIWPDRTDACWIYMEVAPIGAMRGSTLQRVLRVHNSAGQLVCEPNALPGDGHSFLGAWGDPDLFAQTTPEMLVPIEACAFLLTAASADGFAATIEHCPCEAARNGARLSCELRVSPGRIDAQPRFMNADGSTLGAQFGGPFEFIAN